MADFKLLRRIIRTVECPLAERRNYKMWKMGSKIHAWPPQRFILSIRLRCGTWAPGDVGTNWIKDIKKHLDDFCQIMCVCRWKQELMQALLERSQAANDCWDEDLSSFEVMEPMLVLTHEWLRCILFTQVQQARLWVSVIELLFSDLWEWRSCRGGYAAPATTASAFTPLTWGQFEVVPDLCDTTAVTSSRKLPLHGGPQYHRGVPLTFMSSTHPGFWNSGLHRYANPEGASEH